MASKRCLSIDFYQNDRFLSLAPSAINLYTYLNLYADDYGIVTNPITVMRICGSTKDDLEALIDNDYIIRFDSKKIAIKHWLQHNQIQPSKLTKATNLYELKQLLIIDDKREYILISDERAENMRQFGGVSLPQYKTIEGNTINPNKIEPNAINPNKNNLNETEQNEKELQRGKQPEVEKPSFQQNVENALSDEEYIKEMERIQREKLKQ